MLGLSRPCVPPQFAGGFSLITTAVALTAVALIFVSVLPSQDYNQAIIANNRKLERVQEAMRSYMAAHGELPCPADGQNAVNTPQFGVETDTLGDGKCTGAPLGPDTVTGNLVGGTIPTRTLGLPDDDAIDSFGHRFTFVVDKRATQNKSCLALTTGSIAIESKVGGTVLGNPMQTGAAPDWRPVGPLA